MPRRHLFIKKITLPEIEPETAACKAVTLQLRHSGRLFSADVPTVKTISFVEDVSIEVKALQENAE